MPTPSYLHPLPEHIELTTLRPQHFTFPFHYTPHPLCMEAARQVRDYLHSQPLLWAGAQEGKMFGVLIVETDEATHSIGFIAAYSAQLAGTYAWPWFVPPIVDILRPDCHFPKEEACIARLTERIDALEHQGNLPFLRQRLQEQTKHATARIARERLLLAEKKRERDERRKGATTEKGLLELQPLLTAESQRQKADYRRLTRMLNAEIQQTKEEILAIEQQISGLKAERQHRSIELQRWIFAQYRILNAQHHSRPLTDFFDGLPPSGAGECCAPKLLQCAYANGWKPLCMAEFWMGPSPADEWRKEGRFYPACRSKCRPILAHMLQGLDVEPNPVLQRNLAMARHLKTVYSDADIVVVNKPSGMLSVPGNDEVPSVKEEVARRFPEMSGPLIVHRLDMDTSGLMVLAKNIMAYRNLQRQFEQHAVRKRYEAIVEGHIEGEGCISLPLCPNPDDRPLQMVSAAFGKEATTRYRAVDFESRETTRLHLWPITGRTHQLRVHCAHPSGLNCPIVGDALYGTPAARLLLHAAEITFLHPRDGRKMRFCATPDF